MTQQRAASATTPIRAGGLQPHSRARDGQNTYNTITYGTQATRHGTFGIRPQVTRPARQCAQARERLPNASTAKSGDPLCGDAEWRQACAASGCAATTASEHGEEPQAAIPATSRCPIPCAWRRGASACLTRAAGEGKPMRCDTGMAQMGG